MHSITALLPLIDHYASFTRVQENWGTAAEGTITGHETVNGLVVKVAERWDDTQGVPLYQGVEVHFDDASVLLISPSDSWRLEAWGDLHEEAMVMLAAMDPGPQEDDGQQEYEEAADRFEQAEPREGAEDISEAVRAAREESGLDGPETV